MIARPIPEDFDAATYVRHIEEVEAALAPFANRILTPELVSELKTVLVPIEERWAQEAAETSREQPSG
jgi:hypothetical protein